MQFVKPFAALCLLGLILPLSTNATAQESLSVGDAAPDFEIQSLDGETIKLSDRFGKNGGPTIVLFSRANW